MPPLERMDLRQRAVLWPTIGKDRFAKDKTGSPVEIPVRWLDKQTSMLNAQGDTVAVDATAVVMQDIPLGSWMWLGHLADLPLGGQRLPSSRLMEVKLLDGGLDIKARNVRRTVGMIRLNRTAAGEVP